jgi:hypothetical protein
MNYRLKSLVLLAALPLCVAAMSREAAATDRYDVEIEVIQFYTFYDTDPSGLKVNYSYNFNADIDGAGRRQYKAKIKSRPQINNTVGRKLRFRDIEEPERSNRQIKFSAKVTSRYVVLGLTQLQSLGNARGVTSRDLFREADKADDDKAVETVAVRNKDFVFYARVTVTEID